MPATYPREISATPQGIGETLTTKRARLTGARANVAKSSRPVAEVRLTRTSGFPWNQGPAWRAAVSALHRRRHVRRANGDRDRPPLCRDARPSSRSIPPSQLIMGIAGPVRCRARPSGPQSGRATSRDRLVAAEHVQSRTCTTALINKALVL